MEIEYTVQTFGLLNCYEGRYEFGTLAIVDIFSTLTVECVHQTSQQDSFLPHFPLQFLYLLFENGGQQTHKHSLNYIYETVIRGIFISLHTQCMKADDRDPP